MKIDYPRRGRTGVRRFVPSWKQLLSITLLAIAALIGAGAVAYAVVDVPQPTADSQAQTTIVTYSDGRRLLGRFGDQNRILVDLDVVPRHVQDAVIAAEDRSFYGNQGVSPTGVARALYKNLTSDSTQGGSTITQQYVKNAYLTQERTFSRKFKEVLISVKIDRETDKDQILEDYLNTIYWGRGTSGIATASQAYFGKSVAKLTVSEGAFLAGIINAPGRYDPKTNRAAAEARWNYVLDGMVRTGALSPQERAEQTFPAVRATAPTNRLGGPKGYLLSNVRSELRDVGFSDQEIDFGGLRVRTTIDYKAQQAAVAAVNEEFYNRVENTEDVHVGLAAVEAGTGAIKAMYGGPDYVERPGVNDATVDNAQVGSTFKPFTLAAALEEGISLRSRYDGNSGLRVPGTDKRVDNEFGQNYGRVDLVKATRDSINTAFVDLTMDVGAEKVKDAAVRAGIPSDARGLEANASITLGVANLSPMDMAFAYSTFAGNGMRPEQPFSVLTVKTYNGGLRYEAKPTRERIFKPDVVADTTYAMEQVVRNGTGTAALALGRPAAGKTGTAALRPDTTTSAWFAGFTPQLSAAVGFYKGNGTEDLDGVAGLSTFFGGEYPTRVWTAFMEAALDGKPVKDFPPRADIGRRSFGGSDDSGFSGRSPRFRQNTQSTRPTPSATAPSADASPTESPVGTPTGTPDSDQASPSSGSPSTPPAPLASASPQANQPSPGGTPRRTESGAAAAP